MDDSLSELLLRAFLSRNDAVCQAIQSYNQFIDVSLPSIVRENCSADLDGMTIRWVNPRVQRIPGTDVQSCIRTRSTYYLTIVVDLHCCVDGKAVVHTERAIADFPLMTRSRHCSGKGLLATDPGGWFCIAGVPKAIVQQLKVRQDVPLIYSGSPNTAQCRSSHPGKWRSTSTLSISKAKDGSLVVAIPFVFAIGVASRKLIHVPCDVVLVLCGYSTRQEVARVARKCTAFEQVADWCGALMSEDATEEYAYEWIQSNVAANQKAPRDYAEHVMRTEFLPHACTMQCKRIFFVMMLCKLRENEKRLTDFPRKDDLRKSMVVACVAVSRRSHPSTLCARLQAD